MTVQYIAYDGKAFDNEKECKDYEMHKVEWRVKDILKNINRYKRRVLPQAHAYYMNAKKRDVSWWSKNSGFSKQEKHLMIAEERFHHLNQLKENQKRYRMLREELRAFHEQIRSVKK